MTGPEKGGLTHPWLLLLNLLGAQILSLLLLDEGRANFLGKAGFLSALMLSGAVRNNS